MPNLLNLTHTTLRLDSKHQPKRSWPKPGTSSEASLTADGHGSFNTAGRWRQAPRRAGEDRSRPQPACGSRSAARCVPELFRPGFRSSPLRRRASGDSTSIEARSSNACSRPLFRLGITPQMPRAPYRSTFTTQPAAGGNGTVLEVREKLCRHPLHFQFIVSVSCFIFAEEFSLFP